MASATTCTTLFYFLPPTAALVSDDSPPTTRTATPARYPSSLRDGPFHPAFGPVPSGATFPIHIYSSEVVQLVQKYQLKALPFALTPDEYTTLPVPRRTLAEYLQLNPLVWMDVIFPAERVLYHRLLNLNVITERDVEDISDAPSRHVYLDRAHLQLDSGWLEEETRGRDKFAEMQVLVKLLDEWRSIFRELVSRLCVPRQHF